MREREGEQGLLTWCLCAGANRYVLGNKIIFQWISMENGEEIHIYFGIWAGISHNFS